MTVVGNYQINAPFAQIQISYVKINPPRFLVPGPMVGSVASVTGFNIILMAIKNKFCSHFDFVLAFQPTQYLVEIADFFRPGQSIIHFFNILTVNFQLINGNFVRDEKIWQIRQIKNLGNLVNRFEPRVAQTKGNKPTSAVKPIN